MVLVFCMRALCYVNHGDVTVSTSYIHKNNVKECMHVIIIASYPVPFRAGGGGGRERKGPACWHMCWNSKKQQLFPYSKHHLEVEFVHANCIHHRWMESLASPSDSLDGAHAHAINTRPSFLPRGAGSEEKHKLACMHIK